jgi:hypothetical protein
MDNFKMNQAKIRLSNFETELVKTGEPILQNNSDSFFGIKI